MIPEDIDPLITAALDKTKELCLHKHYDLAMEFCETIIELDAENADAWFLYGVAQVGVHKPLQAVQSFDNAAKYAEHPDNKEYATEYRDKIRNDLAMRK